VIKIAKGFEMNVLGFDAFPKKELETTLGFKYVPLEELLSKSDVITLHVPYNQDTHHLLNEKNMGQIKKGAILVNTARGEVVDTQSLLKAINDGVVSAAGLDVLEGERQMKDETGMLATGKTADFKTLLENHVLIDLPQVAITPHIAFFTKEAKREILQTSVDNLLSFSQGKPINTVK
jgi:D-lactate dehydrogenase